MRQTFLNGKGFDQQGIVLRLQPLMDGRVSGITVTRNVWGAAFDVFNYHVWNTRSDPQNPFTQFGSTIVPTPPDRSLAVYPLHLCARTATATDTVQFVVWTGRADRAPLGTTDQGGQATLPPRATVVSAAGSRGTCGPAPA